MAEPPCEIIRFIQTWIIVYLSLTYSFYIGKLISPGKIRFLFILPIVVLFLLLPLRLTTIQFGGLTAFSISWLATFKLILFSFSKPPLSSKSTSISLLHFIASASLPIKITLRSKPDHNPVARNSPQADPDGPIWKRYVVKAALMAVVFKLYDFKALLHPTALLSLYCFHVYFFLEFSLAFVGAAVRAGLGLELEPQFNEPYKATSLRDFWGRRWNLVVSSILRPTVYSPLKGLLKSPLGPDKAQSVAILVTFSVSGIMHELMLYFSTRMYPTGVLSSFFVLHGVCVVAETLLVRHFKRNLCVPRIISSILTVWFVMSTAFWLFFPEFLRGEVDVRVFREYTNLGEFVDNVSSGNTFRSFKGIVSVQHFFTQIMSF